MFIFGHLGLGAQLVRLIRKNLPWLWLYFGCALPDLIDKPTYYVLSLLTGRSGAELGLICGSRTLAHTALFALILLVLAFWRKSTFWMAVTLGDMSHLLLDVVSDHLRAGGHVSDESRFERALWWPFHGWQFPVYPFSGLGDHLHSFIDPVIFTTEGLGILFLVLHFKMYVQNKEKNVSKS